MTVGVLIATWRQRRRGRPATSGSSLTDLALDQGLRAQIKRLDEEGKRLRAERNELLAVVTRLAELLDHGSEQHQISALDHARGPTEEHSSSPGRTPDRRILLKGTIRSVTPLAMLVVSNPRHQDSLSWAWCDPTPCHDSLLRVEERPYDSHL